MSHLPTHFFLIKLVHFMIGDSYPPPQNHKISNQDKEVLIVHANNYKAIIARQQLSPVLLYNTSLNNHHVDCIYIFCTSICFKNYFYIFRVRYYVVLACRILIRFLVKKRHFYYLWTPTRQGLRSMNLSRKFSPSLEEVPRQGQVDLQQIFQSLCEMSGDNSDYCMACFWLSVKTLKTEWKGKLPISSSSSMQVIPHQPNSHIASYSINSATLAYLTTMIFLTRFLYSSPPATPERLRLAVKIKPY